MPGVSVANLLGTENGSSSLFDDVSNRDHYFVISRAWSLDDGFESHHQVIGVGTVSTLLNEYYCIQTLL